MKISRLAALSLLTVCAQANIITYTGRDLISSPADASLNADVANGNYIVAVPNSNLISLAGLTPGTTNPVVVGGMTITWTNQEFNTIRNTVSVTQGFGANSDNFISLDSFDTTQPVSAVLSFDSPIDAFGAFFTGAGNDSGGVTVSFNDGSAQSFTVQPSTATPNSQGAIQYFGFTDFGASISSVTVAVGTNDGGSFDIIGFDAIRVDTAAPEPSTWLLLGVGLGGLVQLRRRRMVR